MSTPAASKTFSAFPTGGLQFLRRLKRNNNREWFNAHKSEYQRFLQEPMTRLIESLALDFERFAPEMIATPKVSAYRIYRDTRFSRDKAPYKTHVAASFPRSGIDKHQGAGLYLHIGLTEVLIGGGVYMPMPEELAAVRRHIAENFQDWKKIIGSRSFKKLFVEVHGERLIRPPRGFPAEHPASEYLKLKQFLGARRFSPEVAVQPVFYKTVIDTFQGLMPFIRFINEPILRARRARERQESMLRF